MARQTASDFAAKYAHREVYELQPEVQMTAKFAANGSVCEMKVEQEYFLKDRVDMRFGTDRDKIDPGTVTIAANRFCSPIRCDANRRAGDPLCSRSRG